MLVLAGCTALDAVIIRLVGATIHPFEIGFFRVLFALMLVAPWLARTGWAALRTDFLPLHACRAVLKLFAQIAYFYAILIMPLADVAAIGFTKPIFVAIGAALFLGEIMRARRWSAIALGFVGILIILRPTSTVFDPWILTAVLAAMGLAGVNLMMKFLAGREATTRILAWNLMISVPIALVLALPGMDHPHAPRLEPSSAPRRPRRACPIQRCPGDAPGRCLGADGRRVHPPATNRHAGFCLFRRACRPLGLGRCCRHSWLNPLPCAPRNNGCIRTCGLKNDRDQASETARNGSAARLLGARDFIQNP